MSWRHAYPALEGAEKLAVPDHQPFACSFFFDAEGSRRHFMLVILAW